MLQNVIRAMKLDTDFYNTVERDASFTPQAFVVVVVANGLAGVGILDAGQAVERIVGVADGAIARDRIGIDQDPAQRPGAIRPHQVQKRLEPAFVPVGEHQDAATRFQVFARVYSLYDHLGVTLKVDVPDDTLAVDTWVSVYNGVNWHEREAHEMYGIVFEGHPGLRHLYLPGDFEGHPLRKDFPLVSRRVKPWPGIVDVEGMPGDDDESSDEEAAS